MVKILVIAPTPFFSDRGTHIRILEEALALEKLGHKITIATYHIGRDINSEVETEIDVRRIRRLLFWYEKLEAGPDWQKVFLDIMLIRKAFYLARTQKPDIIHAHLHEGALIGWIVRKCLFWRKMKLVCDFHGSLTKEMVSHQYLKGGLLKIIFKRVEWFINNVGDFAITSSWENTAEISTFRKNEKIETVLDGVNLDYYKNLPVKADAKKALELPEGKMIAVYTGALVPNKGTKFLKEAILKLKENKDIFFAVAGFPIEEMEKFVAENNLRDQVRLIHPLNYFDLPQLLNACDIGIDPKDSTTRQASGKILQYMAAGLPVACFDRENNRQYLGEGAYFAKKISGESLAEGIAYFAKNPEQVRIKGEIARARAENLSWQKSAEKIDEIYKNLLTIV